MLFEFLSCFVIVLPITSLSLPFAAQGVINTTIPDAIFALDISVHTVTSSPTKASATLNVVNEDCPRPPSPGEHRPIALQRDCFAAAYEIFRLGRWGQLLSFSRRAGSDVRLPVNIRRGACCIYMTMFTSNDQDLMKLETIYEAALGLAVRCYSGHGQHKYGGRAVVGPLGLLHIFVARRSLSDAEPVLSITDGTEMQRSIISLRDTPIVDSRPAIDALSIHTGKGTAAAGQIAALVEREEPVITDLTSNVASSTNTAVSAALDTLGADSSIKPMNVPIDPSTALSANSDLAPDNYLTPSNDTTTIPPSNESGIPICTPPPYPGQLQHPIKFADCKEAIYSLIGFRDIRLFYTFGHSSGPVRTNYQLPQKFRHGTCTIYLDMAHADDVDTVKLGDVTSTARYLAYTCSGSRSQWAMYGGHVTVGLSGRDLVVVWIYGRRGPPRLRGVGAGEVDVAD
ncbi:hypothetical protein N7G274_010772 [Stereocaulon virgatum]|uniref:Uncharacterized protein n=1 Tax=Stereocaulon virgatum TaxID=373712 RepID=A0ABR3ZUI6_9LECA